MNGAWTTFSYLFNAILSDQPLVWFQILFLEPVLEDCFWVAGESRVLLEHFMGMKHAAFKVQLFGLPEVHQIWKREQSHRSGSALVSNGLDCWTSKTSKLRPKIKHMGGCFNLKKNILRWKEATKESRISSWSIRSRLVFCSCIRVQGWMAHPPPPQPLHYIYTRFRWHRSSRTTPHVPIVPNSCEKVFFLKINKS